MKRVSKTEKDKRKRGEVGEGEIDIFHAQSAFECMGISITGSTSFPFEDGKFQCSKKITYCYGNSHKSKMDLAETNAI